MRRVMERKFNRVEERDSDKECSQVAKSLFENSMLRQNAKKYSRKTFKRLSPRHQHMIEDFINWQLGHSDGSCKRDAVVFNEIKNGRVSFAFEGLKKIPRIIVEILKNDITHLDLSYNRIKNFAFLRCFINLKSLIIDGNNYIDIESVPSNDNVELFYANNCCIEFPRSFIFRVSVAFKSLKYLSMMSNPLKKEFVAAHIWQSREHRIRTFAIFMIPKLVHFNDKTITDAEQKHSEHFHQYLGPIDCQLAKFKTLPDTDDIRKILPVHIRDDISVFEEMQAQDEDDRLDVALNSITISEYYKNYLIYKNETKFVEGDVKQAEKGFESNILLGQH